MCETVSTLELLEYLQMKFAASSLSCVATCNVSYFPKRIKGARAATFANVIPKQNDIPNLNCLVEFPVLQAAARETITPASSEAPFQSSVKVDNDENEVAKLDEPKIINKTNVLQPEKSHEEDVTETTIAETSVPENADRSQDIDAYVDAFFSDEENENSTDDLIKVNFNDDSHGDGTMVEISLDDDDGEYVTELDSLLGGVRKLPSIAKTLKSRVKNLVSDIGTKILKTFHSPIIFKYERFKRAQPGRVDSEGFTEVEYVFG